MRMNFGRHDGTHIEEVFLNDPGYIRWLVNQQGMNQHMMRFRPQAHKLITIFDYSPYVALCSADGCTSTCQGVVDTDSTPVGWCGKCLLAEVPRSRRMVRFNDMLGTKADQQGNRASRRVCVAMIAKGLPKDHELKDLLAFFS